MRLWVNLFFILASSASHVFAHDATTQDHFVNESVKIYKSIGCMSGTSADGVGIAYIETNGEGIVLRKSFMDFPYSKEETKIILSAKHKDRNSKEAKLAEQIVTINHAKAINELIEQHHLSAQDIDFIGFHGQTIWHRPEEHKTCQIGDAGLLAKLTGIPVIADFRTKDMLFWGQGAPLVPLYHKALAKGLKKPTVFLNLGGVANITYIGSDRDEDLIACDTGPASALIDDWMRKKTGQRYDKDGHAAAAGQVDEVILAELMRDEFFKRAPPKSLDRDAFSRALRLCYDKNLSLEDGAATLTAFTVKSVVSVLEHLPEAPKKWIVCGGGRHNKTIMAWLKKELKSEVVLMETLRMNGDATEAEAFAYLAARSFRNLPLSVPGTTGVLKECPGGLLYQPPESTDGPVEPRREIVLTPVEQKELAQLLRSKGILVDGNGAIENPKKIGAMTLTAVSGSFRGLSVAGSTTGFGLFARCKEKIRGGEISVGGLQSKSTAGNACSYI
ncbi:MAG: anhydro-N-acetylmuramic acid kinase [Pseudomonadota bacterium]